MNRILVATLLLAASFATLPASAEARPMGWGRHRVCVAWEIFGGHRHCARWKWVRG